MENAYARSVNEVLDAFGVDPTKGLTDYQVAENSRIYGENVLPQEESTPFWKLLLKQFDDLLMRILIAAAIISFVLALINGETGLTVFLEPSVIFMILAVNAAVGVITETNAEKALEELRAYQADVATVLRNGCFSILPATELVPGDIVEVGVGCKVPADMRMIEMLSNQLRVDQAILTGKETLRCLALALKRMPTGQQMLSYEDEANLTFIGLVGMLDPPREEVRNAMLSCMHAGICVIVVTGDNKTTAESLCRKIGAFDHLEDFSGYSYTASEFESLSPLQRTLALQRMVLFTRVALEIRGYLTLLCSLKLAPRLHRIRASFGPLLSLEKGEFVVSGSEDSNVYFYDLTRPKHACVNKLQGHGSPVIGVGWNYGENWQASYDSNGTMIVWKRAKTS